MATKALLNDHRRDSHISQSSPKERNGMNGTSKHRKVSTSGSTSPRSSASPLIEVDVADSDEADDVVTEIHVDGSEENLLLETFKQFPYAVEGDYVGAATAIWNQLDRGMYAV